MRIPILYIPKTKFKKFLYLEQSYTCLNTFIPIGSDCHPAYTLQSLFLRKNSYPFDWLNIVPSKAIQYVDSNLQNKFSEFLTDVDMNERGYFVSKRFPESEFMHEKYLNTQEAVDKFNRRIRKLLEVLKNEKIIFLHNIPANNINSEIEVNEYIHSVKQFLKNNCENGTLHIYVRFDENESENHELINSLTSKLNHLDVKWCKYVRGFSKYGTWGDKRQYHKLLKSLSIDIRMTFPKIYLK